MCGVSNQRRCESHALFLEALRSNSDEQSGIEIGKCILHSDLHLQFLRTMAGAAVRYATKQIQCTFPVANVLLISMGRAPVNAFNDALWFELRDHFRVAVSPPAR